MSSSSHLKIYEKQTAASRGKLVARDDTRSPDEKAIDNKHHPGWFARPEKYNSHIKVNQQSNRSQRGMNRSNNESQGQSVRAGNQIFNDEEYQEMV